MAVNFFLSDFSALTKLSDTEEERNTYSVNKDAVTLVPGITREVDVTYDF